MVEDEALVARAMNGDEVAFAALLEASRGRAWAICFRICGNRHDAEDALQDASVAAWRRLDRFRGDSLFSTWFYRIAANAALQSVRRRRDVPTDELSELAHDDAFAERFEAAELVQQALGQLQPDFRAALVLREWGELTYTEIAAWQRVPVQTVKSRLNRARAALAALLAEVEGVAHPGGADRSG